MKPNSTNVNPDHERSVRPDGQRLADPDRPPADYQHWKSSCVTHYDKDAVHYDNEFLVKLLYTAGVGADDIEIGSRQVAFWTGLFDRFADSPRRPSR